MPDRISWTVDDRPVRFSQWSADCVAHGGYRDFSGTAQGDVRFAGQEAEVRGYRRDGSPFWYGKMTLDPEVTDGGASIVAQGPFKGTFSTQTGRQFFMTRSETDFKAMDAKPYEYSTPGDAYDWKVESGVLRWIGKKGEDVKVGDLDGCVFWADGCVLTNINGDLDGNNQLSAKNKYRIETAFGPSGTRTQEGSDVSSGASSFDIDLTETSGDLVNLMIRRDSSPDTIANQIRGFVRNIEVRGLATSSVFTVGDCYATILQLDDRASVVAPTSLDVMPLDFKGTNFDLGMYLAKMADWWFMILAKDASGTASSAGPWEDEIQVARRSNARTQLTQQPRYNRVRVPWTNTAGDQRYSVADADPDPFPDEVVEYMTDALEGKFRDDSEVPQDIADGLIGRYAGIRRSGTVEVASATLRGKRLSPYEIMPAVLADIIDHDPPIPSQRVESVAWDSSGRAQLNIELEDGAVKTLQQTSSGNAGSNGGRGNGGRRNN